MHLMLGLTMQGRRSGGESPQPAGPADLFWTWTTALYPFDEPNPQRERSRFPTDTAYTGIVTDAGMFETAVDLSESDPIAMRNDNNLVDLSGGDFTVELWVNRGTWENFANIVGVPGSWDFIFNEWGGTPSFRVYDGDNNTVWSADMWGSLPENTWQHFCFERSGNMFTSYVNGAITGQSVHETVLPELGNDVYMTFGAIGEVPGADALVDDFRFTKAARYNGTEFDLPAEPNRTRGIVYTNPVAIFDAGVDENVDGYLGGVAGLLHINKLGYPLIGCWILDSGTQLRIAIDVPELDLTGHSFVLSELGSFPVSEATVYNPEGYTSFWYDLADPLTFETGETYSLQLVEV